MFSSDSFFISCSSANCFWDARPNTLSSDSRVSKGTSLTIALM